MKLTFNEDEDRFEMVDSEYGERMIPKNAGFRWDPDEKLWYTKDEQVAVKLIEYADTEVFEILDRCLDLS